MADVKKTAKKAVKKVEAAVVKTVDELREDLTKALQDLHDARRSRAQGELINVKVINTYRKTIARLHTTIAQEVTKLGKESK